MSDINPKRKKILDKLKHYPHSLKDFSHHEHVTFIWEDGEERDGIIHIIDRHGTDFCYGVCPSFDILVENEDTIYKHIPMVDVKKK